MAANGNEDERPVRVLIADDHEVNRELLEFVLEETYTVVSAKDGVEALELALQEPLPDIILLDIMMPNMNGYEVCQRLKENPKTRNIPVIFITAAATQENETKGLEIGAIDYITKPITPKIVLARIRNHVAYLKAQRRLTQAQKSEALAQVVTGVAHEINTPVGIMLTAGSFLNEAIGKFEKEVKDNKIDPGALEKFLARASESANLIVNNAQRASELIKSFKQISADQVSEAYRTITLSEYLESILASLGPRLKKARIAVEIDCSPTLQIKTYPGALAQIITNLAVNAIDHAFRPDTDAKISIKVTEADAETLLISFSDNGKGIPQALEAKVFEPFFTTNRNKGGTGLGLSIVNTLATETLQGSIDIEGREGQGARFTLQFKKETPRKKSP